MKFTLIFGGIIFILLSLSSMSRVSHEQEIQVHGKLVKVTITDIPSNCKSTKGSKYIKFDYQGKIYSKQAGYNVCDRNIGDIIEMRYLEKYETLFLYSNERVWLSTVSTYIILLFGIVCMICGFWYIFNPSAE